MPPSAACMTNGGNCVPDEERWLSVTSVARLCGRSPRTIRDWCQQRLIAAEQDARNAHWRIPLSAAMALLEERKRRARELLVALEESGGTAVYDDVE
jgi:hypothetical protein